MTIKYVKARVYQEVFAIIAHDVVVPAGTPDDQILNEVDTEPEVCGRTCCTLRLPGDSSFEDVRHHKIISVEWEELPPDDEPDDDDHQLDCRTQGDLS